MSKNSAPLENFGDYEGAKGTTANWSGKNHPFSGVTPTDVTAVVRAGSEQQALVFPDIFSQGTTTEVPPPIQQAIESGAPVRFSSSGENQAANRQPDYYLTPDGKLVANPNAKPSADGSINIEIQTQKAEYNKSLRDAIIHETDMQKQAAKEMIRLFQQAHPGEKVPGWMEDLANAKPNLPDFVPFPPAQGAPVTPPPENGFVPRGVSGGSGGDGGFSGFAGNGGFDSNGYFQGNGSPGDGSLYTGGTSSQGQPLGQGEQVQAKQIYDYMTQQYGLTPAQASGILGNMQVESSFNTKAYNSNEGAIGLCQWEGSRRTELEQFANSPQEAAKAKADGVSNPVLDWKVQVDFMMHELHTTETGAWDALQQAQTPQQAAAAFDQFYERSSGAARGQRVADAENIYQHVANA